MAHFTCVGATEPSCARRSTRCGRRGIGKGTCSPCAAIRRTGRTTGRRPTEGLEYSRELVELIGSDYEFTIGAACFPEDAPTRESADSDLRYLAEKVEAGVDFLITQMFFDNDFYFDFVRRARGAGVGVPIIPGIMPITRVGQLERMAGMCGSAIPDGLRAELHAREDDAEAVLDFGVAHATLQCAELLAAERRASTSTRSTARRRRARSSRAEAGAAVGAAAIYPASISSPSATRGGAVGRFVAHVDGVVLAV